MSHIHVISRSKPAPGFNLGPLNPVGIAVTLLQIIGDLVLRYIKGMQASQKTEPN